MHECFYVQVLQFTLLYILFYDYHKANKVDRFIHAVGYGFGLGSCMHKSN